MLSARLHYKHPAKERAGLPPEGKIKRGRSVLRCTTQAVNLKAHFYFNCVGICIKRNFWPSWHPGGWMVLTSKAALFSGVCLHFQRGFCQSQVICICYKAVPIITHEPVEAFTHWKLPCGATGGWDKGDCAELIENRCSFAEDFCGLNLFNRRKNRWFRIFSGRYLNPCIVIISNLSDGLIWVFTMVQSTVLKLRRKKAFLFKSKDTNVKS